jgi:hypothetical protein
MPAWVHARRHLLGRVLDHGNERARRCAPFWACAKIRLRLPRVFDDTYATFSTPVNTIRLTVNALSSVSGKVTATILQAGIA